jgi:hypothetical protein
MKQESMWDLFSSFVDVSVEHILKKPTESKLCEA